MTWLDLFRKYVGRTTAGAPSNAERARVLREATLDELVAAGLCECGERLDAHRPVPEPPRITSWMTLRSLDQSLSGIARANAAQGWSLDSGSHFRNTR